MAASSRRKVLKAIGFFGLTSGLVGRSAWAVDEVAKESDPIAMGFKYCEDSKSATCKTKDKGADGVCGNCVHFNKDGKGNKKIGGKAVGPCALMQNKLVTDKGTCSLFAKK